MKRKLTVIVALIGIFILFILVRFFIFEKTNQQGRIKVLSSPTAGVFVNNEPKGKTPFEEKLPPGEYTVKLIPEGEDSKTVSWEGKVTVYANTLTYVSRELGTSDLTSAGEILAVTKMEKKPKGETGEVSVVTDPAGSIVFLDNDEKGIAPLTLKDVPAGEHELAVYLPGFFRRTQKINIEKGYVVVANFKLALDKTHKTLEQELTEKQQEASESATTEDPEAEDTETDTKSASTTKSTLTISETPTGFLNVRDEPSTAGTQVDQVTPGDEYEYTDEKNGWYKIKLSDGSEGWVLGDYVDVN